jgi:hypothetical protein
MEIYLHACPVPLWHVAVPVTKLLEHTLLVLVCYGINYQQFFFCLLAVLGLDVVTSESLFGYESANKDMLAVVAGPDISGERIVLPDTSQFLQPAIQVSRSKNSSQFIWPFSPDVCKQRCAADWVVVCCMLL